MTAIADLLDPADRAKLLARLRQLEQLATLMQEVPEQQAACEPPSLTEISETTRKTAQMLSVTPAIVERIARPRFGTEHMHMFVRL